MIYIISLSPPTQHVIEQHPWGTSHFTHPSPSLVYSRPQSNPPYIFDSF